MQTSRFVARLALCLFALLATRVQADEVAVARDHFQRASKAFDLGLYEKAITEYMAAYEAKDDPAILYNLGQAHRLAGHRPEAMRYYRLFLTRFPRTANRAAVEERILGLEQESAEEKRKLEAATSAAALVAPVPAPAPEPSVSAEPPAPAAPLAHAGAVGLGRRYRWAWVGLGLTAALGASAIGVGAYTAVHHGTLLDRCGGTPAGCSAADIDSLTRPAHATDALLGLAAAAGVATIVLFVVEHRRRPELRASAAGWAL